MGNDLAISGNAVWTSNIVVPADGKVLSQAALAGPVQGLSNRTTYLLGQVNAVQQNLPYLVYRPGAWAGEYYHVQISASQTSESWQLNGASDPRILIGDWCEVTGYTDLLLTGCTPGALVSVFQDFSVTQADATSGSPLQTIAATVGGLSPGNVYAKLNIVDAIQVTTTGYFAPFVNRYCIAQSGNATLSPIAGNTWLTFKFYHA